LVSVDKEMPEIDGENMYQCASTEHYSCIGTSSYR